MTRSDAFPGLPVLFELAREAESLFELPHDFFERGGGGLPLFLILYAHN
jgi:hypothetical protein